MSDITVIMAEILYISRMIGVWDIYLGILVTEHHAILNFAAIVQGKTPTPLESIAKCSVYCEHQSKTSIFIFILSRTTNTNEHH